MAPARGASLALGQGRRLRHAMSRVMLIGVGKRDAGKIATSLSEVGVTCETVPTMETALERVPADPPTLIITTQPDQIEPLSALHAALRVSAPATPFLVLLKRPSTWMRALSMMRARRARMFVVSVETFFRAGGHQACEWRVWTKTFRCAGEGSAHAVDHDGFFHVARRRFVRRSFQAMEQRAGGDAEFGIGDAVRNPVGRSLVVGRKLGGIDGVAIARGS